MEFRLIYEGSLPSNGKPKDKHAIRKEFHKQLAELWQNHRGLKRLAQPLAEFFHSTPLAKMPASPDMSALVNLFRFVEFTKTEPDESEVAYLARNFEMCGFNFVPLVSDYFALFCELDILFLRRETSGQLVLQGGDIDNRLKTLFDALHVPKNCSEVPSTPDDGEKPFYCLLEDDSLITGFQIRTDRLLTPLKSGQNENDVMLVINVVLKMMHPTLQNLLLI